MVARDEHERIAGVDHGPGQLRFDRQPLVVRSPAKNSGRPPAARSSAGSAITLLWRSDASVRRGRRGGRAARADREQPGEADQLVVEVLLERLCGVGRLLGAQRDGICDPFA